jgi:hypothetical protein
MKREQGKKLQNSTKSTDLEDTPCGTAVDPQRLVQRPVERGALITELLLKTLLQLSLDEMGRRGVGILSPQLQARRGSGARR